MKNAQRIAEALKELYLATSGLEKDTSIDNIDIDDMLGAAHGFGMSPERTFEFTQILGFSIAKDEIEEIWKELKSLVG